MNDPSKSEEAAPRAKRSSRLKGGVTFSIACVAVYTLVMLGVWFKVHHIGLVGGVLTLAGMFIAARWYNRHQKRSVMEILPLGPVDDQSMKGRADRPLSVMPSRCTETNLLRDDQRSDRTEPREPFFGPGAAPFLAELTISVGALGLLLLVLLLTHSVKERASGLMFGGSQHSQPLESGKSTATDGYKIKRID